MDPSTIPHADEHADLQRSPTASISDNPPKPQEKDDSHSGPELHIADANARHRLLGFLPTVFVLFITLGFAFLILGWLLARQYEPIQNGKGLAAAVRNGSFIVYEGGAPAAGQKATVNLRVLTFSALLSHLISDTSSILMTLVAYRAGSQWLQNSRASDLLAIMQNPTPLQLLVRLLGSSSIISIYETGRYAVHPQKRSRLPRLFKEALAFAVTVWIMSHAVGLADLYLHTTTRSILVDLPVVDAGSGSYPYAVDFNETLYSLGAAIVVPGAGVDLSFTGFTARTFSARASCRSLNHDCERDSDGRTNNGTQAGYPGLTYFEPKGSNTSSTATVDNYVFGVVDGRQGGSRKANNLPQYGRTTNPVNLAIQMRWSTHIDNSVQDFEVGQADAAVDILPIPYITLYSGCSVTFSNVTVQYLPYDKSWRILLEEKSSDNFTTVMWAPTVWQLGTEQLASEMMTIAMTEKITNVTAALNQRLARMMLGVAVGTLQYIEATDVKQAVPRLLGQYPVAPDETIIIPGQKKKDGTPEKQSVLNLTQRWLVDPLPLVAAAFPGEDRKDVQRTVADSALDMV
ncbi:hypothetical protein FRC00_001305 [Tulasnella sp. 408]|nr:hypothetical protein FRC00_001305 [Tulasnella sp. 408]